MKLFTHPPSPEIARWDDMTDVAKSRMRDADPDGYEDLLYAVIREKSKRDFWYFLQHVVANRALEEELHRPIADWLQNWEKRRKLLLVARGHVKSNLASVAFPVWLLCNNRNLRILIDSHTAPDSIKFAMGCRTIMEDPQFQRIFPYIRPKMAGWRPTCWRADRLQLERDIDAIEGSIETSSLDKQVTGRHYNFIISDDLVTYKNVQTPEQIIAVKDYYRHNEALLDPGARRVVVGTPYDYYDLYGDIRTIPDYQRDFEYYIQPADAVVDTNTGEVLQDGVAVYSSRYTMEDEDIPHEDPLKYRTSLPGILRKVGAWIYQSQYRLDPISSENATFQKSDVEAMEADCLPLCALNFFRVCDLSSHKATKDSRTAILTFALDPECTLWITDIFLGNYTSLRICEELIRGQQVDESRVPQRVGFETAMHELILKTWLDREMERQGVYVPRVFLPGNENSMSKDNRIRGLQPFIADRKVRVLKTCPHKEKLYTELLTHPRGSFKDIIDALAKWRLVAFAPRVSEAEERPKPTHILARMAEELKRGGAQHQPIGSANVMRKAPEAMTVGSGWWD